jgi:hypothetical protein
VRAPAERTSVPAPDYIAVGPDLRVRFASLTIEGIRAVQNKINVEVCTSPNLDRQRDSIFLSAAFEVLRDQPRGTKVEAVLDRVIFSLAQSECTS